MLQYTTFYTDAFVSEEQAIDVLENLYKIASYQEQQLKIIIINKDVYIIPLFLLKEERLKIWKKIFNENKS